SIDASGHELFESVHQRKDGSRFPVLVETTTIKDEKGRPVSRVGFSVDITEQKKSEEKLRKSEARLRRFYESGLLGVIYWNMDGEITSANERFLEMTGYNREELETGQIDWVHMTPPEFRHLDEKAIIELKTKGVNKKSFEKEYIRKDGSRISIELAGAMLDEKRFDGVAFVLDISERKLVEMELIQAATQWQTTFDASNDAIWILDEAHHILRTNKKAGRLFQIPNEGLGSKNCCQIIHGSEIQIPECPLLRSKVSLKRESLVLPLGEKWFAATVDPILDENGQYAGAVHTLSDITEHRNMEAQLHQSQKMDSIGRLAGGVAHDFNNMLSIINGYSDIALERLNPSDPLYEDIHEIKDAGRRSADLTRQLLGFARKQIVKPEIVDLNIPINQSVKMIQRLVSEDVTIELIQAPDIWLVNIDSSQLDQILVNLAVNSRDAIDGVGNIIIETANITLDADYCSEHLGFSEGQFVTLTFTDTGRGMDKETQQKMFEPFFTTKDEGKGTGLGLSTLYGIVKQNNGFINVYSELDQGTAFKIYLPRVDEVEEKPESNPVDVQSLTGSETILVVEDEKQILRLCQRILEINGYKVITADKPGEAIVLCEKFPGEIHFLITDVVMPSMNGKELHERIKRIKPNIKALYMSGYTANVIAHRGVLTEGVRFIQKPFSPKALVQKVREILDATKERTHD
ncbi:MAG: PAS domain S-box protein, partial [Desulfobacula sp.]|nr:PAS domain S-box protein [Desulfobacula sp.]